MGWMAKCIFSYDIPRPKEKLMFWPLNVSSEKAITSFCLQDEVIDSNGDLKKGYANPTTSSNITSLKNALQWSF